MLDYSTQAGYLPTDTGLHTLTFSVNQSGDAFAGNNNDTMQFRITDTVLSMNVGVRSSTWYVQEPPVGSTPVEYSQVGIWFEIPQGKSDTVTSVTAAVANGTTAGSKVQVQIYKQNGASWDFRGETSVIQLTSGQISTATALTLFSVPMDVSNGVQNLILDGGYYAAVMRGVDNPATNTILIPSFQSPAFGTLFSYGTSTANDNQIGSQTYGGATVYHLANSTPVIRPNFGRISPVSINDVSIATVGSAYPNPANTQVSIPVSLSKSSEVTVSLSNAQGQVLATQQLGKQASGHGFEITFPTAHLASGIYFYTVEAAGEKKTGRVTVAH
jgi:hypothetical protein